MRGIFLRAMRAPRRGSRLSVVLGLVIMLVAAFGNTGAAQSVASTLADTEVRSAGAGAPESPSAICPAGGQCFADVPASNPFYNFVNRIYEQDLVSGYACGGPAEPCDVESRPYYRPGAVVTRQQMAKFIDNARHLPEIRIETTGLGIPVSVLNHGSTAIYAYSGSADAIYGQSNGTSAAGVYGVGGIGVLGHGNSGAGVSGTTIATGANAVEDFASGVGGIGVKGLSGTGTAAAGVFGESASGNGVLGYSDAPAHAGVQGIGTGGANGVTGFATLATGYGVYGYNSAGGLAGYFQGNAQVTGSLAKGAGSFKIDHPLDPANKYLYHSFVESPDMMNVYNGNVTLDAKGEATVRMPDWFDALNKEFRYQLTAIGAPGPNLYIASKMENGSFKIAGGAPGSEVSWLVTGIRQDPYADEHRIPVEEVKPESERGKYLHATEWGQPESKGIGYISTAEVEQLVPGAANTEK